MLDDTARYDANQHFAQGTPVYDVNGDKVGTVADFDQRNDRLVIQKGLFFPKDFPVPMSAIARSDADGVYLNVSKDDVTSGNFAGAGTRGYATDTAVDVETPYSADPARSVGDRDLSDLGDRTAATADAARDDRGAGLDRPTAARDQDVADRGYSAADYNTDIRRADQVNDNTPTANP